VGVGREGGASLPYYWGVFFFLTYLFVLTRGITDPPPSLGSPGVTRPPTVVRQKTVGGGRGEEGGA